MPVFVYTVKGLKMVKWCKVCFYTPTISEDQICLSCMKALIKRAEKKAKEYDRLNQVLTFSEFQKMMDGAEKLQWDK
jgi:hypothetical protein